ncbi:hypothetical protein [Plasmodium yoelii yoelii]|uniref:Uncharacterized protein n=1 Tax=Plasmodium yoelii yoelii TaxID=73239 RepID=Q7RHC9_PLAYO|nr:hypothetical protein [Plasmodium yoelii yoelii]
MYAYIIGLFYFSKFNVSTQIAFWKHMCDMIELFPYDWESIINCTGEIFFFFFLILLLLLY